MTKLAWDETGQRRYETGVDHGVLYVPENGVYSNGVAWNGLTTVTESPSGAEASAQYADNIKYLNLVSAEEFGATIEAFTYPDEFEQCDGTATPVPGVHVGQQGRKVFGFSYRTLIGNDVDGQDAGYKLHLVYGALAAPSEKAYATVNDSPEAIAFSWEVTTTPVNVGTIGGNAYKPTALLTIDSTKVDADALQALEDALYGTAGADARLPLPSEVIAMFAEDGLTEVTPTEPTFANNTITIPNVTGVVYTIDNEIVSAGAHPITENTVVASHPADGYRFPENVDTDWGYTYTP